MIEECGGLRRSPDGAVLRAVCPPGRSPDLAVHRAVRARRIELFDGLPAHRAVRWIGLRAVHRDVGTLVEGRGLFVVAAPALFPIHGCLIPVRHCFRCSSSSVVCVCVEFACWCVFVVMTSTGMMLCDSRRERRLVVATTRSIISFCGQQWEPTEHNQRTLRDKRGYCSVYTCWGDDFVSSTSMWIRLALLSIVFNIR